MITFHYTWSDFGASIALIIVAVLILMADAFCKRIPRRGYAMLGGITAITTGLLFGLLDSGASSSLIETMGHVACIAAGLCMLIAFDYNKVTTASVSGTENDEGTGELYALFLIATAGITALTQAKDLITLFVALEVVTLSSYVMVGYYRRNRGSIEAGVKYLVQGALSTGILVFGAAWYFGATGSFALIHPGEVISETALLFAYILLSLGLIFKVGGIPMSAWIPDVYQGAPTPVSAFLSTCSKIAGVIALILLYQPLSMMMSDVEGFFVGSRADALPSMMDNVTDNVNSLLLLIAVATLFIGNIAAINQRNAKRLLGYSSIGQAGFILVIFVALTSAMVGTRSYSIQSIVVYVAAYSLASIGAFAAIGLVRMARQSEEISSFRGLAKSNPYFAFLVTVFMASLAGVPLTAGFLGKFLSFYVAITYTHLSIILLPAMIFGAAVGFYYYFKIIRAMYWEKAMPEDAPVKIPVLTGIVMSVLAITILAFGFLAML